MNIKLVILFLFCMSTLSCTNSQDKIDLSQFDKTNIKSIEQLKIKKKVTQTGHWELNSKIDDFELLGNELSTQYFFNTNEELQYLSFDNLNFDKDLSVTITKYQNELAYFSMAIDQNDTFELIGILKMKLGTDYISFRKSLDKNLYKNQILNLEKNINGDLKNVKDEFGYDQVSFTEFYLWEKKDYIVFLKLGLTQDNFSNKLTFLTKKVIRDKIISGYSDITEDTYLKKIKL